ncbi:ester cyclase [Kibdelosporangium persicum]|uniref:SnoaL-like polyketide cyclase n=1 Tax=Kibdelosporangium persicum TaxID=2698649 RepID=A0ABX2F803_9PSEU|nr:ester cyclase [Kibdelosporangium persicum]NRN67051.1 SnoaL-like polyketide cyclase [Kibdelosporangium persicum]
MAEHDIYAVYQRLITEAFNKGDLSVVDEILAPDFLEHEHGAETVGPEPLKQAITGLRTALPDVHLEIVSHAVAGDKLWCRILTAGTNTGPFMHHAPTGLPVKIETMDETRFVDGRMAEHWGVVDNFAMFMQLGLVNDPTKPE